MTTGEHLLQSPLSSGSRKKPNRARTDSHHHLISEKPAYLHLAATTIAPSGIMFSLPADSSAALRSLESQFDTLLSALKRRESEDEGDDILNSEDTPRALRPMTQSLDSPLLDTGLIRLETALDGRESDPRLASRVSLKADVQFISLVKARFPGQPIRIWQAETTIRLLRVASDAGRTNPVPVTAPNAHELFSAWWSDQLGTLAGPVRLPEYSPELAASHGAFRPYELLLAGVRKKIDSGDNRPAVGRTGPISWVVMRDRVGFLDPEYGVTIATTPFLWCVHDALRTRFTCHLGLDVLDRTRVPLPTHDQLDDLWDWQEGTIIAYGNQGYEIGKAPEALCKTLSSRLSGGSYAYPDAFDRMVDKVRTKELKAGAPEEGPFLVETLSQVLMAEPRYEIILELGGLVKAFGFPIIDPITSGESSRDYGRAPDRTRPHRQLLSEHLLCHLLLTNYIRKHGVWPPIRFSESASELKRLWKLGWLSVTWNSYPLSDWTGARLEQFIDFDPHDNYLPLLKDKSCSILRSQLQDTYDGTLSDRSIRRLLKMALDQDVIDTRALLRAYARNELSRDEYMILEYPKLKEFKVAARMFCMLTLKMRLVFSIVQENVKHGLFEYLPYTSMTMSRAELDRELLRMTSPAARGETLFIEVDLSRWNLCFRDATIARLGCVMDDVFGVNNIFGRFHEFCRQSEVMVLVGDSRVSVLEPEDRERRGVDQCPNYFTGHLGGFEGIDQATWTTATICMIQQALLGEQVTFKLLGQGDNQTLAIRRKPGNIEAMETLSKRIMSSIDQVCDELNHEAKPDEFVDSISQLTYSKNAYVNGVAVPQELKPLSKVAPVTSTDICTFGDAIGALFSGTIGSSSNSRVPERHWLMALVLSERFLVDAAKGRSAFPDMHVTPLLGPGSKERIKLLLAVPSVIGGLPISPVSAYFCRGEPDPLTSALASLRSLARKDHDLRGYLTVLESTSTYQRSPETGNLLRDPFSLPLHTSLVPSSVMADTALEIVRQSRNTHVRELLGEADNQDRDTFIEALMSTRPCFPTILRDIFDISAHGKLDEMAKMFTLTRTFINAAKGGSNDVERKVWDAERKRNVLIGLRLRMAILAPRGVPTAELSHAMAERFRLRWGLGEGTIQGLSCAHPFDSPPLEGAASGSGVRFVFRSGELDLHSVRGPLKPYLGSRTAERRVETDWEVKRSPAVNEIKRLILAFSAGASDANVESHVRYAVAQRTLEPLEGLLKILPTTRGGALAHRYQSLRDEGGIRPNGNPMVTTHVAFSSDHVLGVSGGQDDYPIAFQQWFAVGLGLARCIHSSPATETGSFRLPLSSASLRILVEERFTAAPLNLAPRTIPSNPLLYVPALEGTSRGIRPPREIVVTEEDIMRDPEIADDTLSSALTILLLKRSISSARLELNEETIDDSSRPLALDAAVFDAVGSLRVFRACVRAACGAAPRFFMRVIGKAPHRYSLYAVCYNLAGILLPVISSHQDRGDMSGLTELGVWAPATSGAGLASSISGLRRAIAGDVFTQLSSGHPGKGRLIVPPTTAHISEEEVLALEISTVLFAVVTVHPDTSIGEGKRALRDMIHTLRGLNLSVGGQTAARQVLLDGLFDVLASSPTFGSGPIDLEVLEWLSEPGRSFACPLESAIRALRSPHHRAHRLSVAQRPLFHARDDATGRLLWHEEASDGLRAAAPLTLPELPERTASAVLATGGTRVVGYTSRAASLWASVVDAVESPSLVVGTGAGGVQAALAASGRASEGLDLQETIVAILGHGEGVPTEVTACNLPNARLSRASFDTSGDFWDDAALTSALALQSFASVIVDIEQPGTRPALSLVLRLARVGYVGQIWFKILCTKTEAAAVWSCLGESRGVRRLAVHQLDLLSPDGLNQMAFGIRVGPTVYIPDTYTPRGEFRGSRERFPDPAEPDRWTATIGARIRGACGQFSDTETWDFHDAAAQLAVSALEARGSHRGGLRGNLFLGLLRSWAIAEVLSRCQAVGAISDQLTTLGDVIDSGPIQLTSGDLSVLLDPSEARVRQALLRRAPQALALIALRAKNS